MLVRLGSHPIDRWRRRLIGLAVLLALVFVLGGVYLALSGRNGVVEVGTPSRTAETTPPTAAHRPEVATAPSPIAQTSDPRTFAVAVARALFAWDTDSPIPLSDYTGRLLAVADPTGTESPGLVADVASYLPTASAWAELRTYLTRQWLEVTSTSVPTTWAQAAAEGQAYGVAPGTRAYTITGIRHRAGVWDGAQVETAHEVSFTVFVVCGPTYPTCHLLRISKLDDPLP